MLSIAQISPRSVRRRRLVFFGLCSLIFLLGVAHMVQILSRGGFNPLKLVILLLFIILFGQVAFGVTLSLVGFWVLRGRGDPLRINQTLPPEGLAGPLPSTAVVMPIYNEEV